MAGCAVYSLIVMANLMGFRIGAEQFIHRH